MHAPAGEPEDHHDIAHLLVSCHDRRGVIAAVAGTVAEAGGNILDAQQHADPGDGRFSMRLAFEEVRDAGAFEGALSSLASELGLRWRVRWPGPPPRIAILCSRETHCLADLMWRVSIGEVRAQVTRVISNHEDPGAMVRSFGFEFSYEPVSPETKPDQEARVLSTLQADGVELVVLARYMQVLSPRFVDAMPGRIINIHHSFLPAFAGARPYHQAYERGVKLIGATAHYVTEELDEGPIVAQQTTPVSHRDTVRDMVRKGRDLERVVLAHAVRMHLEDRVLLDGRRTIVFE
ncbi:MAG: formyltetrahydrofolate deformylase [Planctomycetota bacterium]